MIDFMLLCLLENLLFVKGENKIELKPICGECDTENSLDLRTNLITAKMPDDKIMKYYSSENKVFEVSTKSNGIIYVEPPSIGISMQITSYIKKMQQENKKLDHSF